MMLRHHICTYLVRTVLYSTNPLKLITKLLNDKFVKHLLPLRDQRFCNFSTCAGFIILNVKILTWKNIFTEVKI